MPYAPLSQGSHSQLLEMVARLILAAVLGALVGYERETHGRPAGLRTHMLVCMGSTIFTIVSVSFTGQTPDPSRIASQIVSGIGFLGAGTIIKQGSVVRGLTTAASLWTIAAIGMAVGVNWNLALFAVIASVVVFIVLTVMNRLEHKTISEGRYRELAVIIKEGAQDAGDVLGAVVAQGIDVQGARTEEIGVSGTRMLRIRVHIPSGIRIDLLNQALARINAVSSFDWE